VKLTEFIQNFTFKVVKKQPSRSLGDLQQKLLSDSTLSRTHSRPTFAL